MAKRTVRAARAPRPAPIETGRDGLRALLHELYYEDTPRALRFRVGWIVIDVVIVAFFIVAPLLRDDSFFLPVDYAVAALLAADLAARAVAWGGLRSWLSRPIVWLDLVVLATLLFPQWLFNFGFLRVLRLWTLFNSEIFWETLGRRWDDTRTEEVTRALATLLTFVFIVTGFVYTSFVGVSDGMEGYVDALYFTITTLTTTGYGDILLPGTWGRVLSIVTMVVGITLFFRLAQALVRPHKVRFLCPTCGLMRHDQDAVHCKACGVLLNIPNDED